MAYISSSFSSDWKECSESNAIEYATHLFHSITTMDEDKRFDYILENRVKGVDLTVQQLRAGRNTDKRKIPPKTLKIVSLFEEPKKQQQDPMQDKANRQTLNNLAREQLKAKLLIDISIDMQICELEGWSKSEYLIGLHNMLNEIILQLNQ